jgi:hypothetical protein
MLARTSSKLRRRMMPRKIVAKKEEMSMKHRGVLIIWADTFCLDRVSYSSL